MAQPTGAAFAQRVPIFHILPAGRSFEIDRAVDIGDGGTQLNDRPKSFVSCATSTGLVSAHPDVICASRRHLSFGAVPEYGLARLPSRDRMPVAESGRQPVAHLVPPYPHRL